jgi:hypothetical protein
MRHQLWSFACLGYRSSAPSSLRCRLEPLASMALSSVQNFELASAPYSFLANKNKFEMALTLKLLFS